MDVKWTVWQSANTWGETERPMDSFDTVNGMMNNYRASVDGSEPKTPLQWLDSIADSVANCCGCSLGPGYAALFDLLDGKDE